MARNVRLEVNRGADNQRWSLQPSKGYHILENKETKEVLDLAGAQTANGTNIQTYTRNGTDAQLFLITIKNQRLAYFYTISSKLNNNKLLTAQGNGITSNNININSNLNNSFQRFWLRKERDGYYMIFHGFTGKAITA